MPDTTDSPRDLAGEYLAAALHALADQLLIDGQGADTLPAKDTAAKVRALAARAQPIATVAPAGLHEVRPNDVARQLAKWLTHQHRPAADLDAQAALEAGATRAPRPGYDPRGHQPGPRG